MSTYLGYKHIGGKVEVTVYNFIKCTELYVLFVLFVVLCLFLCLSPFNRVHVLLAYGFLCILCPLHKVL